MTPLLNLDEIEVTDEMIDRLAERLVEHYGSPEAAIEALSY